MKMAESKCLVSDEVKGLNTWVEVINACSLKEDVRIKEGLPSEGLIIKKIHKSDINVSYEKMEGGLVGFLDKKLDDCPNIPTFLKLAKEKLC